MMFRRFAIFFLGVAVCLAAVPRPVSNHVIQTTDGKQIRLTQFKGKVTLFAMVLTTCEDCQRLLNLMGQMQKELGPRGFQAIAVSLDDDKANATSYAQRYRPPFPFGHIDPPTAIEIGAMVKDAHPVVPVVMFIDGTGTVRIQYYGSDAAMQQFEKNLPLIAKGLLRQAEEGKGPERVLAPPPPKK